VVDLALLVQCGDRLSSSLPSAKVAVHRRTASSIEAVMVPRMKLVLTSIPFTKRGEKSRRRMLAWTWTL